MTGRTAVVWSCGHAKPEATNERFDWLGSLIEDIKPDYTVDLGDGIDLSSLNSYDTRYPKAIVSQSYEADINSYNDSQSRLWDRYKVSKKKRPYRIGFAGNHCVPKETDVLTREKGWVNITDVSVGDTVMTLSGWEPVTDLVSLDYEGDLYKVGERGVVSYSTDQHRVYYYDTNKGKLTVKQAKELPLWVDLPVSTVVGSGVNLSNEQLRFNAVALTDSYHEKDGKNMVFYQSGDKSKVIRQVILDAGVAIKRESSRDRGITHICGKELKSQKTSYEFRVLKPDWCVSNNKRIPDWAFDLTEKQFEVFLEMLIFCDGSIPTRATSSRVFYGRKEICEDLQSVCVTKGYRATLTEYRPNHWRVNICKTLKCRAKRQNLGPYKGMVYCLVVPSENFLMRQDNKPCFTGNCHRLNKAIDLDPRLEGSKYGISFSHLQTDHWFDDYHPYENGGPAIRDYDGVSYAHYFSAGNYGTAISGMHHAYALLQQRHSSAVCGHSHKRGIYFKDGAHPNPIIGLVVGCWKGKEESWAGQSQKDWWHGVTILRNIENGWFDPEFISMSRLKEEYGK